MITRYIIIALITAVIAYLGAVAAVLVHGIQQAKLVTARSEPYVLKRPDARVSILVVGDSTGVGTGASTPEQSVAGRLAADIGDVSVENRAQNGAKMAEVLSQLEALPPDAHYDLVLVEAGGNDIMRFTSFSSLKENTDAVLAAAAAHGDRVAFMSTGNVGLAPIFLPPLSQVYDSRTRTARRIFMQAAAQHDVIYVDLFKEKEDEPFNRDPKRYYASDGLHPTGDGYALWYGELKAALPNVN